MYIQGGKCLTLHASALDFQMGEARQCPVGEQFMQNRGAFLSIVAGEPGVVFKNQTPMVVEER